MRIKFLFLMSFLSAVTLCADAQQNWQSKGPLYEDNDITIEIEYAIGQAPCEAGVLPSQFRYHITKLKKRKSFYINWHFDYFDCDHELQTRFNSLKITKLTRTGYILPECNSFSALRLVNNFNEVKTSVHLPENSDYTPKSSTSLEPKAIAGKLTVLGGETTALHLQGGYLASGDHWQWYENDCNGLSIGSGSSISVRPRQTTRYVVRAERGPHMTPCIAVTVVVSDRNEPVAGINGVAQICAGEKNIVLSITGGRLVQGDQWIWYEGQCDGRRIGEGEHILVSPSSSITYFVRAEGRGGTTLCRSHVLIVIAPSRPAEGINGAETVSYGAPVTLSVRGGTLASDAQWVWYSGRPSHETRIGTGSSITIPAVAEEQTYAVRAEGSCFQSAFIYHTVSIKGQPVTREKLSLLVNGGLVTNNPQQLSEIKNYVATLGLGRNIGWFLRAKFCTNPNQSSYETTGSQIDDYSVPGYYQYNGQVLSKRTGYTAGGYFGFANIALYLGGGYGTRELLYGIDRYTYNGSYTIGTDWVKNTTYSYTGAEIEGGLILKAGVWNLVGGASTIQGKYTDYNLGIGFNF